MSTRLRAALATLAALALATGSAVVNVAAPAQAAGTAQVSLDGTTYTNGGTGALFSAVAMVPGADVQRPFWVRNASTEAAYLRVTLADVVVHDQDFADQLAVRASLSGWPGSPIAVAAAQPCYVLSQGPVLPSGSTAKVTTAMELGDLTGLVGQAGAVSFTILVTLTSDALTSLPATDCPATGTTVIGYVGTGDTTSRGTSAGTAFRGTAGGGTTTTGVGGSASGPLTTQPGATTAPGTETSPAPFTVLRSNTGRLWQELDVAFWLALAVAGLLVAVYRRRRKDSEEGAAP